jgi:hypothetical protein
MEGDGRRVRFSHDVASRRRFTMVRSTGLFSIFRSIEGDTKKRSAPCRVEEFGNSLM